MATAPAATRPAHVPEELVVTLPLYARKRVDECPQETMIPQLQATLPPISYVTNIFPGDQPGWLLTGYEDTMTMLRDPDNFTKNGMGKWAQNIGEDWLVIPTEADPPIHTAYRAALNPKFAPQKMAALREQVRERARTLIDKFKDGNSCDFIDAFSEKYPINIVLDLLDLPQDRMAEFLVWEKEMLHTNDWEVRGNAVRKVKAYLMGVIEERQKNPGDDYISQIFDNEVDGRKWNIDEVFGHCFNLYLGGLDTVTSLLGNIFCHLARYPERQRELREKPGLIVTAVEEYLRAYAPVTAFRIAAKEIEICGQKIMPGEYISVATPITGYDPNYYDQPELVRFDRKAPHISLGGGIHKCLGMHLARMEMQIAMEEFLTALPEFRLKDGFKVQYFVGNIMHVPELELQWG